MRIAILGAGYTGLSIAYHLSKNNHQIIIFEKEKSLGGLAASFKKRNWRWPLEQHYHHLFTSDNTLIHLAKEINHPITYIHPKTAIFYQNQISKFDSPTTLLRFPHLSPNAKFRTGITIAFLKINPFWQPLEKIPAAPFLKNFGGNESWSVLWQPLFQSKFGRYTNQVPASWFWARIKKRTKIFGYPQGGFDGFLKSLQKAAQKNGVQTLTNSQVKKIIKNNSHFSIKTQNKTHDPFDIVISTLPSPIFLKIAPKLGSEYTQKLKRTRNLSALNIVLSLKQPFLPGQTYWLNINDARFPFLGVVEHTNFINKKYYNNEHLIYLANYLPPNHRYFKMTTQDLIKSFTPYLQKINPDFKKNWILNSWKFPAPFAQPIMTTNYSQNIPTHRTPIKSLYIANMQQVYPWDRQTNYALKMGQEVANLIINDHQ